MSGGSLEHSTEELERLLEAKTGLIERISRSVASGRLSIFEVGEFVHWLKLRLAENDYALLRTSSNLSKHLTSTIQRLLPEYEMRRPCMLADRIDMTPQLDSTMKGALAQLPVQDRKILRLHRVEKRPRAEIARLLGVESRSLLRRIQSIDEQLQRKVQQSGFHPSDIGHLIRDGSWATTLDEELRSMKDTINTKPDPVEAQLFAMAIAQIRNLQMQVREMNWRLDETLNRLASEGARHGA